MTVVAAIVARNEARVIGRCIRSVAPFVSSLVLCDTGSTDRTVEAASEACRDVRLSLTVLRHEWAGFATNYTAAFEAARAHGDYVWLLDADHVVASGDEAFAMPRLVAPGYAACRLEAGDWENWYPCILRSDAPWRYEGERHAAPTGGGRVEKLRGVDVLHMNDGANGALHEDARRARYARDAEHFAARLAADPTDTRAAYYRAQSLHDAGRFREAVAAYRERAEMVGGNPEEAYLARLYVASYARRFGAPPATLEVLLQAAYRSRPTRAEAAVELARWCNDRGDHEQAVFWASRALEAAGTDDRFLVRRSDHTWRPHMEIGRASTALLSHWATATTFPNLPAPERVLCEQRCPDPR